VSIVDLNGRAIKTENGQPKPEREPLGVIAARHLGGTVLTRVDQELEAYSARHRLEPSAVHARLTSNKDKTRLTIELSHEINGVPMIGTPRRKFSITLLMGV
jgi:hypothetical protein